MQLVKVGQEILKNKLKFHDQERFSGNSWVAKHVDLHIIKFRYNDILRP